VPRGVFLWTKEKKGVDRRGRRTDGCFAVRRGAGEGLGRHILTDGLRPRAEEW